MDDFSMYHIPCNNVDWNSIQPTFFQTRNPNNTVTQTDGPMVDSEECFKYENSRPVSAYAIFFRERQILVKKSNPQASFGDISRIVATQWDSLAINEKLQYKRRSDQLRNKHIKMAVKERVQRICGDFMSSSSSADTDSTVMISKQRDVSLRKSRSLAKRLNS